MFLGIYINHCLYLMNFNMGVLYAPKFNILFNHFRINVGCGS